MTERPIVKIGGDDYEKSVTILKKLRDSVELFQYDRRLVQVVPASDTRPPHLQDLDADSLRALVGSVMQLEMAVKRGTVIVSVTRSLAMNILSLPAPDWQQCGVHVLDQLRITPHLTADFRLLTQQGYDAWSRTYLQLAFPVDIDVPMEPTEPEIRQSVDLLLELIADFPFVDEGSRTSALALMLEPLVRMAVDGCAPAYCIDATVHGTGKGLLLDTLLDVTCGEVPRKKEALPTSDTELEKRLVATLLGGESFLLFDNVNHLLDSPALCALLTAEHYGGRILGQSQYHASKVRLITALTGNQVRGTAEINRRLVPITLDAALDGLEQRSFRIPFLRAHVRQHRQQLLQAALTLVQGWIAQGRPLLPPRFPSFEQWYGVMGGIMKVAGREETFLSNRTTYMEKRALDATEAAEFVEAWFETHGTVEVPARDLAHLVRESLLLPTLQTGLDSSLTARLALYIGRLEGRIFNGVRVTQCGRDKHRKVSLFRLEILPARATRPASAGSCGDLDKDVDKDIF